MTRHFTGHLLNEEKKVKQVERVLNGAMKNAVDAMPCPDCGYLQRAMVKAERGDRLGWLMLGCIGGAMVLGATVFLAGIPELGMSSALPWGVGVPLMVGAMIWLWLIYSRDYNAQALRDERLKKEVGKVLRLSEFPEFEPLFVPELMEQGR